MNRKDALRKLQACLQMAASSNAHEQAAALRQARKLMEAYGLTEDDAASAEYVGVEAPTRQRKSAAMPEYLSRLAHVVGDNFACAIVLVQRGGSVSIEFVGKPIAAKLAGYAFTVLRRQLDQDAGRHIARVRRADARRRRRELFAQGWVIAVKVLLDPPPLCDEEAASARAFIRRQHGELAPVSPRQAEKPRGRRMMAAALEDVAAGYSAGQRARLNAGIEKHPAAEKVTQLSLAWG
ncbi:DUF2786 domain-containing protein [Xanthomonas campestris pv. trichodesmae]|uniref:DUF2786 domain-containing protein n=2 Tax=Xanthomonas citri TaxID=346 RepID=A0AB33CN28_XANCI|nr:DUF2786 domain-containing protein [Xanthomonas citri]ASK94895.1 hypothetical protein XcvCFBP7111P_25935 [Xanthomonas citri pv. vignicola]MBV6783082.1 DUF2786 domain-containing protein [Xanthomonas campestris pv. trichodesmae]MBZ3921977.1 hypothetical protein [Xanthomonas campestris pv. trichodesmae]MBZ3925796.1 hypothetical protein [Xanthomonas citri pv. sesbaniae]